MRTLKNKMGETGKNSLRIEPRAEDEGEPFLRLMIC